jgi:integrase
MNNMNKLYNPQIKEEFLKTYDNEQTQNTIRYLLFKAYSIEMILDKDLYNFSLGEVGQVLLNSDPLNLSVAKTNARFLTQYISWAIEKGLRNDNLNPLRGIDANEWASKFVSKKKIYFSENELFELESKLVNYQDKAIIRLLFESVNGHGVSEILNLKESDIDTNNLTLKLKDIKFDSREITVTKYCMDLIVGAISEREYMIQNGTKTTGNTQLNLVQNDYVIRPVDRKTKDPDAPADKHTVYRRLAVLGELFDLPYLTVKNIHRSGMIKMARDKYLEHGSLEYEQLSDIAQAFGLRTVRVNGYDTYNTTILREYLNEQNIMELYPEVGIK